MLVHADAGGYKPLNWMTPPTVLEDDGETLVVRKRAGKTEDRLEIRLVSRGSDAAEAWRRARAWGRDRCWFLRKRKYLKIVTCGTSLPFAPPPEERYHGSVQRRDLGRGRLLRLVWVCRSAATRSSTGLPECGGHRFERASLFGEISRSPMGTRSASLPTSTRPTQALVRRSDCLSGPQPSPSGPASGGLDKVGRSLSAHIRFDDPTVSRRHALVYPRHDEAHILDRSLNGVFGTGSGSSSRSWRTATRSTSAASR